MTEGVSPARDGVGVMTMMDVWMSVPVGVGEAAVTVDVGGPADDCGGGLLEVGSGLLEEGAGGDGDEGGRVTGGGLEAGGCEGAAEVGLEGGGLEDGAGVSAVGAVEGVTGGNEGEGGGRLVGSVKGDVLAVLLLAITSTMARREGR